MIHKENTVSSKLLISLFSKIIRKRLPLEIQVVELSLMDSQKLNKMYRKKNKPTNVLSFRYGKNYGEILLCLDVIKKEAKRAGNTYRYQMTWMILHGMLHLAGMHHENSKTLEKRVEKIEEKILAKIFKP